MSTEMVIQIGLNEAISRMSLSDCYGTISHSEIPSSLELCDYNSTDSFRTILNSFVLLAINLMFSTKANEELSQSATLI